MYYFIKCSVNKKVTSPLEHKNKKKNQEGEKGQKNQNDDIYCLLC